MYKMCPLSHAFFDMMQVLLERFIGNITKKGDIATVKAITPPYINPNISAAKNSLQLENNFIKGCCSYTN
jgi:hypothetical protein